MCDVSTAVYIGGLALGVVQFASNERATAKANEANAQIEENNLSLSEAREKAIIEQGADKEVKLREDNLRLGASRTAAFVGAGVDATTGTPSDLLFSDALRGESDALTLRYNTVLEAFPERVNQENTRQNIRRLRRQSRRADRNASIFEDTSLSFQIFN